MGGIARERAHNDKPCCGIDFTIDAVRRRGMTRAFMEKERDRCASDTQGKRSERTRRGFEVPACIHLRRT